MRFRNGENDLYMIIITPNKVRYNQPTFTKRDHSTLRHAIYTFRFNCEEEYLILWRSWFNLLLNKACGAKHSRVQVQHQRQRFDQQQHARLEVGCRCRNAFVLVKILARTSVDCWAVRCGSEALSSSTTTTKQTGARTKKMTPAFPCSFLHLPTLLCCAPMASTCRNNT
jgi:hypothetical protein